MKEAPKGWHFHKNGGGLVENSARVCGDAQVCGDAWEKSPLYIQGTCHSITYCAHEQISIGCMTLSFDEWRERAEEIGKKEGYSPLEIETYKLHIEHIIKLARLNWPERYQS